MIVRTVFTNKISVVLICLFPKTYSSIMFFKSNQLDEEKNVAVNCLSTEFPRGGLNHMN